MTAFDPKRTFDYLLSYKNMDIKVSHFLRPGLIAPVGITLIVLLWTFVISPFTKYGDDWAIYPVLFAAMVVPGWHVYLVIKPILFSRLSMIFYGVVHIIVFLQELMLSLMLISKDDG